MKLKPLAEQVILITGASSGIGLATARAAARAGAKVALVARSGEALAKIARDIEAEGGEAEALVADVGDFAQLRAAADGAIRRFGRIDSWVNNAGVTIYADLLETPLDEHERMVRTNYFGVVHGAMLAAEHLRERGGALITVGSVVSDIPTTVMGAYAATKHAIKGYVESLRIELGAAGLPISVTLIKPSGIDTPIGRHGANHGPGEGLIPPPVYAPELVADAILKAAVHPTREITVGGAGRAQVLFGTHFPALFERLAPLLAPLLFDEKRPKTAADNLDQPVAAGEETSGISPGRPFSLYTGTQLHPWVAAAGLAGVVGLGALLARRAR